MTRQSRIRTLLGTSIISLGIFGGIGSAHAGGFLADTFVRPFSPALADAADGASAAIRDRSSDASVYNQVFGGLGQYNNPIGRPAPPAGPMPPASAPSGGLVWGNFCSTAAGVFGPGPMNPVGMSCHVTMPNGALFLGQVVM